MIPQLDGTFNVSDSSNTDLHDYLDLASTNVRSLFLFSLVVHVVGF